MLWLRFAMIQSDPPIRRMTIRTPKASAKTLLVLSGPEVMCSKNTRCTPIASTTSATGMLAPIPDRCQRQRERSPSAESRALARSGNLHGRFGLGGLFRLVPHFVILPTCYACPILFPPSTGLLLAIALSPLSAATHERAWGFQSPAPRPKRI